MAIIADYKFLTIVVLFTDVAERAGLTVPSLNGNIIKLGDSD